MQTARLLLAAQLRGVERSAALCAVWRWKESAMPSPLVLDPFAKEIAQEGLGLETADKLAAATFAPSLQYLVALRTRLLDDRLLAWCGESVSACQVVQLGVGCDTRALRLMSDARFFEVDTPRVVAFRQRWVQHLGQRVVQVGLDLKNPDDLLPALVDRGFDPRCATAWVCEGLLEYHNPSFTTALLKVLSGEALAPQLLILAVLDRHWLDFLQQEHSQKPVRMAWKPSRLPPLAWHKSQLLQHGWELREVLSELRWDRKVKVPSESLFHVLVARRG